MFFCSLPEQEIQDMLCSSMKRRSYRFPVAFLASQNVVGWMKYLSQPYQPGGGTSITEHAVTQLYHTKGLIKEETG